MIPVTLVLVGTSLGVEGTIPPLVVGTTPFFARLVENVLREVDRGVIEACQAMGAKTHQIVFSALLPEAMPGLLAAATVTTIALVSYAAMSGVVGGGGLGDLALRYGYQRFQTDVMIVTVSILVVLVQLLQLFEQAVKKKMLPTMMPVKAPYNASAFGRRVDPFTGQWAMHEGIDFLADAGSPIAAAAARRRCRCRSHFRPMPR